MSVTIILVLILFFKHSFPGEPVIGKSTTFRERNRSASILCRSINFRVPEGPIKLSGEEWLCLQVRSAGKVFRSFMILLKITLG